MSMQKNVFYNDLSIQCKMESSLANQGIITKKANYSLKNRIVSRDVQNKSKERTLNIISQNLTSGLKLLSSSTLCHSNRNLHSYYFTTKKKMRTAYNSKEKKKIEKKPSCPLIHQLNYMNGIEPLKQQDFIPHKTVRGNTHWASIQSQLIKEKLRYRNKTPFTFCSLTDRSIFASHFKLNFQNRNLMDLLSK